MFDWMHPGEREKRWTGNEIAVLYVLRSMIDMSSTSFWCAYHVPLRLDY